MQRSPTQFCLYIHLFSNQFLSFKGAIQVYTLNKGEAVLLNDVSPDSGVKCGTFGASSLDERQLATGDHGGKLTIYDIERFDVPVFRQQAHSSIVNAIDGCGGLEIGKLAYRSLLGCIRFDKHTPIGGGAPEIVTGGRDGCVRLWDPRVAEPVLALEPGEGQATRDCWFVSRS
jgi:WD40 repeat protein